MKAKVGDIVVLNESEINAFGHIGDIGEVLDVHPWSSWPYKIQSRDRECLYYQAKEFDVIDHLEDQDEN